MRVDWLQSCHARCRTAGLAVLLFALSAALPLHGFEIPHAANRISFEGDWAFALVESTASDPAWTPMPVPGNWEIEGLGEPTWQASSQLRGRYQREVRLPDAWRGQSIYLHLEGVNGNLEVSINGVSFETLTASPAPVRLNITEAIQWNQPQRIQLEWHPTQDSPAGWGLSGLHHAVSLLALPHHYLERLLIEPAYADGEGTLAIRAELNGAGNDVSLAAQLLDQSGETVARAAVNQFSRFGPRTLAVFSLSADSVQPWHAENPALYQLQLRLQQGNQTLAQWTRTVGFRSIETSEADLFINDKPIALKGAHYYPFHPDAGFALTESLLEADLQTMRGANLNALNLIHQPPSPALLRACDRLGLYAVVNLDAQRWRDQVNAWQHHPSIIMWNLDAREAPQEPLPSLVQSIQAHDPARPIMVSADSIEDVSGLGDVIGLHDPAWQTWPQLEALTQPAIAMTLLPAYQNAVEGIGDFARRLYQPNALSGGFIQQFADWGQVDDNNGDAEEPAWLLPSLSRQEWLQAPPVQRREKIRGQEGLFSYRRQEQRAARQVRQAMAPIRIVEESAAIEAGRQTIELTLQNRFDFTNLRHFDCEWSLWQTGQRIAQDALRFDLPPRTDMPIAIRVEIPDDYTDHEYQLRLLWRNQRGESVASESVWLRPANWRTQWLMRLRDLRFDPQWMVTANPEEERIEHRRMVMITEAPQYQWFAYIPEHNIRLIQEGPRLQVRSAAGVAPHDFAASSAGAQYRETLATERRIDRTGPNSTLQAQLIPRATDANEGLNGLQIKLLSSPYGYIDAQLTFPARRGNPQRFITGFSFTLPPTLDQIAWLGRGPGPAYPGLKRLEPFGIIDWRPLQTLLPGNRSGIQAMALTNAEGYGLGLLTWDGDIHLAPSEQGTRLTLQALLPGPGSGSRPSPQWPPPPDWFAPGAELRFRMVPLLPGRYPTLFSHLFENH